MRWPAPTGCSPRFAASPIGCLQHRSLLRWWASAYPPGQLDTVAGVATDIPTLPGFVDFPLKAELQKRFAFPVDLENDAIAAAIGEWQFGIGKGLDNLVYVTVSTGIGGGVISDGRVVRGRKGMAAHVGHMSVVPNGELCPCGNRGCFEAYGSGPAFARRAQMRAVESRETTIGSGGGTIDSRSVFAAARYGDRLANQLVDEEAEVLGRGFTSLIHIFSPDIIVMGEGSPTNSNVCNRAFKPISASGQCRHSRMSR